MTLKNIKNIILIFYGLILVLFFIGSIIYKSHKLINYFVSALSIASAFISLAELFYTKASIDKDERIQLKNSYNLCKILSKNLEQKIIKKYKPEVDKIYNILHQIFNEDEQNIILTHTFSEEQKKEFISRITNYTENENDIKNFCTVFLESMPDEILELYEDDIDDIDDMLSNGEYKENTNKKISKFLTILGFICIIVIFIISSLNNNFKNFIISINNPITIIAFLCLIINILLKENYRSKSFEYIEEVRKDLFKVY